MKPERKFKAIPKSAPEEIALDPVIDESTALTGMMMEILDWFFNEKGKHRDLLLQASFADAFSTNPSNSAQQKLIIQPIATYQYRQNPSITIQVGNPQSKKTGLGIALEHSRAANGLWCLQKRSINTFNIKLMVETGSEQTTNKLAKLLTEIFFQHLPQQYQNVVGNDQGQSQIIFPQEYSQPTTLVKEPQNDSNVERLYMYVLEFDVEFESIRFIKGSDPIHACYGEAKKFIDYDLPKKVSMGSKYIITVKTNILLLHLYSTEPGIFMLEQMSGPEGEAEGEKVYQGVALRTGKFKIESQEGKSKVRNQYDHEVVF